MRLKDKQTGEIVTFANIGLNNDVDRSDGTDEDVFFALKEDRFYSLAELNKRFEDAPEEIKPFEEVAKATYEVEMTTHYLKESAAENERRGVGSRNPKHIKIADQDYYEVLPDGTKKTTFTWDEAMEIEKKTHGKWRVPTVPECFAICAAFGRTEDGVDVDPQVLKKNLNLATDEDGGYGYYWSAATYDTNNSRNLYFNASYLNPRSGNLKGNGFAVRCVAGKGE